MKRKLSPRLRKLNGEPCVHGIYREFKVSGLFAAWAGESWVICKPNVEKLSRPLTERSAVTLMRKISRLRGISISEQQARRKLYQRPRGHSP
jgi:hypothetical protein